MDKKYQIELLKILYRFYPNYTQKWIDYVNMPKENGEARRNIEYLKEKHYIEERPPYSGWLRITAEGIEYLEKLEKEIVKKE